MHANLTAFFTKYPQSFTVMNAVKMIDKKVDEAKYDLKDKSESEDYLRHLAQAHAMISDLFAEIGIDPKQLL
jgi:hypothetical protein